MAGPQTGLKAVRRGDFLKAAELKLDAAQQLRKKLIFSWSLRGEMPDAHIMVNQILDYFGAAGNLLTNVDGKAYAAAKAFSDGFRFARDEDRQLVAVSFAEYANTAFVKALEEFVKQHRSTIEVKWLVEEAERFAAESELKPEMVSALMKAGKSAIKKTEISAIVTN